MRVMMDLQFLILLVSRSISIESWSSAIVTGRFKKSLGHQLAIDGNWNGGYVE